MTICITSTTKQLYFYYQSWKLAVSKVLHILVWKVKVFIIIKHWAITPRLVNALRLWYHIYGITLDDDQGDIFISHYFMVILRKKSLTLAEWSISTREGCVNSVLHCTTDIILHPVNIISLPPSFVLDIGILRVDESSWWLD